MKERVIEAFGGDDLKLSGNAWHDKAALPANGGFADSDESSDDDVF